MPLIIDPDLLLDSALDDGSEEVYINTTTKTIKLVQVGGLSTDGVTLKALYSFLKEQWKNDPNTKNLAAFPFPMTPITDESFELIDGWDFFNDASRYLIRTGGWTVRNTAGNVIAKWAGIIGLGSIESNDQLYYAQGSVITDVQLLGQVNQAVQILSDPNGDGLYGDGYDRTTSFTLYVREQGQVFGQASLSDIGVTTMDSIAYRFPISTSTDLKINTVDTGIKASGTGFPADVAPFSTMSITYYATPQAKAGLTGGSFNFGIVIDGGGETLQEVYNFVQYALRQNVNIDDDAGAGVTGKIASPLLRYVGDTLYTIPATNPDGGGTGVFIENFDAADQNSVFFVDNLGSERSFPFVATLTLSFNANLSGDASSEYWVYYTTLPVAARTGTDGNIAAAGTTFTSASASFVANDKDALISIATVGPGGGALVARIESVTNSTTVELDTAASFVGSAENWEIFGGDWGERGAVLVDDATPVTPVAWAGAIPGASVTRSYDFDANTQGNRIAPAEPAVTAVAIGLNTGQYVRATGTIARSKANAIALVAPLERNYANPV